MLVNPRRVLLVLHPHISEVLGTTYDTEKKIKSAYVMPDIKHRFQDDKNKFSSRVVACHHYYCKSWEEFQEKIKRGRADIVETAELVRTRKTYDEHNRNDIKNTIMQKWLPEIKKRLGKPEE